MTSINQEHILQAINNILQPQPQNNISVTELIKQSNNFIDNEKLKRGFVPFMFEIICNKQYSLSQRQYGLTVLSSLVAKNYNTTQQVPQIPPEDKQLLKDRIIDALKLSIDNKQLIKQWNKVLKDLLLVEFQPGKWNKLIEMLKHNLAAQQEKEMNASFIIIERLYDVFEVVSLNDKDEIGQQKTFLINETLPYIVEYLQKIIANYNFQTAMTMTNILKIFSKSSIFGLPEQFKVPNTFELFMNAFKFVLQFPIDHALNEQNVHFYKHKKWVSKVLQRFIAQQNCPLNENMQQQFLEISLQNIKKRVAKTQFFTDTWISCTVKYVQQCFAKKEHIKIQMKPFYFELLTQFVIPEIQITKKDQELWENDPEEYQRKESDTFGYYLNLTQSLLDLAATLIAEDEISQKFLQSTFSCFQNLNKDNFIIIYAYMKILKMEVIVKLLTKRNKQFIQNLFEQKICQLIQCQIDLIKFQTLEMYSAYGHLLDFKSNQNFVQISVQTVCQILENENTQVVLRYIAGSSLKSMITQDSSQAKILIKPHLQKIFEIFLKLLSISDNEKIFESLQELCKQFPHDVGPYVKGTVQQICQNMIKLAEKESQLNDDLEDNGESSLFTIFDSLISIVSLSVTKDNYYDVEILICQTLAQFIQMNSLDYFDDVISLINTLIYEAPQITDHLFFYVQYFSYICIGFENVSIQQIQSLNLPDIYKNTLAVDQGDYGMEFFLNMTNVFRNYFQKANDQDLQRLDLLSNQPIFNLILNILQKLFLTISDIENESYVCKVYQSIILEKPQYIEQILQTMLNLAQLRNQKQKMKKHLEVAFYEVILSALYVDTKKTIQFFYQEQYKNIFQNIFNRIFNLKDRFKELEQKQILMLGLSALFNLNNVLQLNELQHILNIMPQLAEDIVQAREDDDYDDENEDEDGHDNDKFNDVLNKLTNKDLDAEDDDDDFLLDNEIGNSSYDYKLENVDEIQVLEKILLNLSQNNKVFYDQLISVLSQQDQQNLKQNIIKSKKWFLGGQDK